MGVLKVTDESFETEVLKSDKPILVDFWAEWCPPCKALAPHLDAVAAEMPEKLTIAKIDINDNPETPTQYGVRTIPTMMIFRGGQVVDTRVGSMTKSQLEAWINASL